MNALTSAAAPVSNRARIERESIRDKNLPLEAMLLALSKFGKPRIHHMSDGWHCALEMYVSAAGVDFKVASGFNLPTPTAAAHECGERLDSVLRDLGL